MVKHHIANANLMVSGVAPADHPHPVIRDGMLGMGYSSGPDGPEPLASLELCWGKAGQTAISDMHVRTKECQSSKVTSHSYLGD